MNTIVSDGVEYSYLLKVENCNASGGIGMSSANLSSNFKSNFYLFNFHCVNLYVID